jgi:lipopolysaccharide transport system ATP-binding protein
MKSSLSIEVINLSKKYRLGTIGMSSLREDLSKWWGRKKSSNHSLDSLEHPKLDQSRINENGDFLALNGLNFSVSQGEVIGIIGANGSGKSTLLKILSRITEPSLGKVHIRGKVASLLEVGTGFHPELTGRENIYINGAILGMSRKEVNSKLDEIVDFSGVGNFIETPIKRYSSGMKVRLGFSVAAHLEPDILIIDEVLAVGDAEYQEKCFEKLREAQNKGKTILIVSHIMNTICSLCEKVIYLNKGKIDEYGDTEKVVTKYISSTHSKESEKSFGKKECGDEYITCLNIKVIDKNKQRRKIFGWNEKIGVLIKYKVEKLNNNQTPHITVINEKGEIIFVSIANQTNIPKKLGVYESIVYIPEKLLNQGDYYLNIGIINLTPRIQHVNVKKILYFKIVEDVNKREFKYKNKMPGIILPELNWKTKCIG